jgi:uncharacterized delta-60 repeat protein
LKPFAALGAGLFASVAALAGAPAGELDPTLAGTGFTTASFGAFSDTARAVATQPDGKIVIAGAARLSPEPTSWDLALLRVDSAGAPDPEFGVEGKVLIDISGSHDDAGALLIQPDGRILLGGSTFNGTNFDFVLVRLNANGTPDEDFGTDGIVMTDFGGGTDTLSGLALGPAGFITAYGRATMTIGGRDHPAIARYDAHGVPDASFGDNGEAVVDLRDRFGELEDAAALDGELLSDSKLLLLATGIGPGTGRDAMVLRLLADGELDSSFGAAGRAFVDFGSDAETACRMAVARDGTIAVVARTYVVDGAPPDIGVARFRPDGGLDAGFGDGGTVVAGFDLNRYDVPSDVAVQADGSVVVAGTSSDYRERQILLLRFTDAGRPDPAFGVDGATLEHVGEEFQESVSALALQRDHRIVVVGCLHGDFLLARFGNDLLFADGFDGGDLSNWLEGSEP